MKATREIDALANGAERVKDRQARAARRKKEHAANDAKEAELHAHDVPCYWIVVSPMECQALLDGVVSTPIQRQAAILIRPEAPALDNRREAEERKFA